MLKCPLKFLIQRMMALMTAFKLLSVKVHAKMKFSVQFGKQLYAPSLQPLI